MSIPTTFVEAAAKNLFSVSKPTVSKPTVYILDVVPYDVTGYYRISLTNAGKLSMWLSTSPNAYSYEKTVEYLAPVLGRLYNTTPALFFTDTKFHDEMLAREMVSHAVWDKGVPRDADFGTFKFISSTGVRKFMLDHLAKMAQAQKIVKVGLKANADFGVKVTITIGACA